ncbi:MAG: beta galactosidase jelly roll domain-containing protein [Planctomycetia bacterium]|nr:beta galactosidase jelly roll domain-containing protein [Planctomycetia bacterium]
MRYLILLLFLVNQGFAQDSPRKSTNLNNEWTFHRDGSKEIKTVTLPTHWETHEGLKFDGIGWYEKTIELPELPKGRRLLLHFDAVATQATVYWNDVKLGEHLGAWTPFRFDVTEHLSPSPPRGEGLGVRGSDSKRKHTIRVRVDEKVGHNTQGFLPIIAPHFGGIWQGVKLIETAEYRFDDSSFRSLIDEKEETFHFALDILGAPAWDQEKPRMGPQSIRLMWRKAGGSWLDLNLESSGGKVAKHGFNINYSQKLSVDPQAWVSSGPSYEKHSFSCEFKMEQFKQWSASDPSVYEFKIILNSQGSVQIQDEFQFTYGFRTITTKGDQFLLNGQPLSIRGVLNWGYYPPTLAPTPTEEQWRSDLKLIKSWGFNLMKCCLWVPPKRLLEIADEEGVLIWLEYPTWHPKLVPQYQAELMQEYKEFHELDRNHPSVILRSLTCETGPGADIKVIQALYDQCKKMCGGLVVDDSSWIEWNRVFDFYDDHPYGNNHTWVATLDRLKKYIATSKYGVKPLCLGEAIAADTWVPTKPMLEAIAKAKADPKQAWSIDERGYPFWVPGFFDANRKWLERMGRVCGGEVDEEKLYQDSLRYARLMRKYQMETYRREVPNGGYVVSVLRDFPLASMGLMDYLGRPKWKQQEWRWHVTGMPSNIEDARMRMLFAKVGAAHTPDKIRRVSKLDETILDYLNEGGNVFLEANGQSGSFPTSSHWFLRGGPFVNPHHPVYQRLQSPSFFAEYQHFELASDVIPNIQYLTEIDPIVMLWDNHDIKEVKTHGLIFETAVGRGRLMVCAINLEDNSVLAKRFLRNRLYAHLMDGPPPRNALKPETIARMRAKLNEKKLDLVTKSWQFMPDGRNEGLKLGWEKAGFDDAAWKQIKIGQHWEGQGHNALDGWAWYRLTVDVPKDWAGVPIYLNSEGVDDAYEIYVNGTRIGSAGDIPNKKTAFEDRTAHAIPPGVLKHGEKNVIAVRVYDWYGAGGIHRPMSLGNVPIGGIDILK